MTTYRTIGFLRAGACLLACLSGCLVEPAAGTGVAPTAAAAELGNAAQSPSGQKGALSQGSVQAIDGMADLHVHMMAEEAFGGRWLHGSHTGPLADCDGGHDHGRFADDLSAEMSRIQACGVPVSLVESLVERIASNEVSKIPGSKGDTGEHADRRKLGAGWPSWDTIAHQQAHEDWLREAFDGGLKLVVMSAVSYDWLCRMLPPENGRAECDERADLLRQLDMVQALDRRHAWLEVALSPAHARRIIAQGKMAVVLSLEANHFLETSSDLLADLDAFYQRGVRTMQIVHEVDNRLSGASLHHPIFQVAQFADTCHMDRDCGATVENLTLGFDVERGADGTCQNVRGLSAEGRAFLEAMMDRHMLIDMAHMSNRAMDEAYELSRARDHYPLYVSHGHLKDIMGARVAQHEKATSTRVVDYLRTTGGMLGLRTFPEETRDYQHGNVAGGCQGSTRSFAQAYEYASRGLHLPVAFGSDFNGFIQQTRPRFGDEACSASEVSLLLSNGKFTPFEAQSHCEQAEERETGRTHTQLDTKGLAHIGLLPALVEDLQLLGADVSPLRRSAETFVRMWERASGPRSGPVMLAPMELDGVGSDESVEERRASYPDQCGKDYCPAYQLLGGVCRFDAECASGQCSRMELDPSCGLLTAPGSCVCNGDDDCSTDERCDKGNVLDQSDNVCRPRRGDGEACASDAQCSSGHCGGNLDAVGYCYTPASKGLYEVCRTDRECRSERCSADGYLNATGKCLCNGSEDCGSQQYCGWGVSSGLCRDRKKKGSACVKDVECASSRCRLPWLTCA
jgi:microsomal dipeptidase-like Zn-dependent dipeptidase